MLQKIIYGFVLALILVGCSLERQLTIDNQRNKIAAKVGVGDDIFVSKKRLESEGLRIKYGPDYPTKTQKYLMMIVDYGVSPNGLETLRYSLGIEGDGEAITGIIKASPDGKIFSIE